MYSILSNLQRKDRLDTRGLTRMHEETVPRQFETIHLTRLNPNQLESYDIRPRVAAIRGLAYNKLRTAPHDTPNISL